MTKDEWQDTQALFDLIGGDIAGLKYTIDRIKSLDSIAEDRHVLSAIIRYELAVNLLNKLVKDMRAEYPALKE